MRERLENDACTSSRSAHRVLSTSPVLAGMRDSFALSRLGRRTTCLMLGAEVSAVRASGRAGRFLNRNGSVDRPRLSHMRHERSTDTVHLGRSRSSVVFLGTKAWAITPPRSRAGMASPQSPHNLRSALVPLAVRAKVGPGATSLASTHRLSLSPVFLIWSG